VVSAAKLDSLSFSSIIEEFSILSVASQAALVLLSAFIVPIGALVAGDGLAPWRWRAGRLPTPKIGHGRRSSSRSSTAPSTDHNLRQDIGQNDARQKAAGEVRGYLGKGSVVKARVRAYLDTNPSLEQLSVNQVPTALKAAGVQAGRAIVADVLQERKSMKVEISG
jgi:hypothetical protein